MPDFTKLWEIKDSTCCLTCTLLLEVYNKYFLSTFSCSFSQIAHEQPVQMSGLFLGPDLDTRNNGTPCMGYDYDHYNQYFMGRQDHEKQMHDWASDGQQAGLTYGSSAIIG
uniref:uncharacterized protein LOC122600106 isoform X2 n=1 Tax=Erigeron canadensis TaxID=72917 RepID=UPI001CB8AA2A|nr:uncharacterized protein LOC122600106 isoform X2 [Erigeron canadensis]